MQNFFALTHSSGGVCTAVEEQLLEFSCESREENCRCFHEADIKLVPSVATTLGLQRPRHHCAG